MLYNIKLEVNIFLNRERRSYEVYFNHRINYLACGGNFRSFPFNWLGSCAIMACNTGNSCRWFSIINRCENTLEFLIFLS